MDTSGQFGTGTPEPDVPDENCEKPLAHNCCAGVPVEKGGDGLEGANGEPWPRVCEHCGVPERPGAPVRAHDVYGKQYRLHRSCEQDRLDAPDPDDGWAFNLDDDGGPTGANKDDG